MSLLSTKKMPHSGGLDLAQATEHEPDMLSSKAKYAVRAAMHLARRARTGDWAQTPEIAEEEDIPRKFLELILVQLRDHGVVESRRGAQGGYRLMRDPDQISVADIIRIVDGPLALTPCASRTRFRPCNDCTDIRTCQLQPLMKKARDAVADVLESCSLADISIKKPGGRIPSSTVKSDRKVAHRVARP